MQCVQCNGKYADEETCSFHLSSQRERNGTYSCCGKVPGCVSGKRHSTSHHSDFAYGNFFAYAYGITGYVDTTESFAAATLANLEDGSSEEAHVGQLLRYVSRGDYIKDQNLLLVRVGHVSKTSPYLFKVFSEKDLDAAATAIKGNDTLIFRNSPKSDQYSQAHWIVQNQIIAGVRLEVKVACFAVPTIIEALFSQFPLKLIETRVVSRGGIVEKKPSEPVALPARSSNVAAAPDLSRVAPRAAREDFVSLDKVTNKQELEVSLEKLQVNQDRVFEGADNYSVVVNLLNGGEGATHMFKQLRIEHKLLNEAEWKAVPADSISFDYKCFPLTLPPFQSASVGLTVRVPFGKGRRPNFYRAYGARHTPQRFRFSFVDTKDRVVSRVAEYVQRMPRLDSKENGLFLFLDDLEEVERETLHLTCNEEGSDLVKGDYSMNVGQAQRLVHAANKSGVTEVHLNTADKGASEAHLYALIDLSRQCVYVIKAQLVSKSTGAGVQGYLPVRFYGKEDAPSSLPAAAHETAALPTTVREPPTVESVFLYEDKGLDDVKAPAVEEAAAVGGGGGAVGGSVNFANIEKQLTSLNENLARTAAALEALVQLKINKHKK